MFVQATASSIAKAIELHITRYGGWYSAWYVGISSEPNDRLVNGHNATTQRNAAVYWDAQSEDTARSVERFFVEKGCRGGGGGGGGDSTTRFVYVYKIDGLTRE